VPPSEQGLAIERELGRKQGVAQILSPPTEPDQDLSHTGLGWQALDDGGARRGERVFLEAVGYELEVGRPPRAASLSQRCAWPGPQTRLASRCGRSRPGPTWSSRVGSRAWFEQRTSSARGVFNAPHAAICRGVDC
jgi:hypothetical protein